MKHIEKVIKTKRKYNHTTAKKVTTSAEMNAGTVLKSNKNNLSLVFLYCGGIPRQWVKFAQKLCQIHNELSFSLRIVMNRNRKIINKTVNKHIKSLIILHGETNILHHHMPNLYSCMPLRAYRAGYFLLLVEIVWCFHGVFEHFLGA